MTASRYTLVFFGGYTLVFFGDDESFLKLVCGNGCTTL